MNNINLDINTYSIQELEKLYKLITPYTEEDIFIKKKNLESNIIKSNINQLKKEELLIFLDNINNKLTNNLLKIDEKKFNIVKQYDGNHFVIQNDNDKYTSTLENNKQVNKSIIKRTYTVDSLFRKNYNQDDNQSHNYITQLPETITKAITMSISSVEIPLTYHNISEELNNNTFRIEVYDNDILKESSSANIELTTGLYETRNVSASELNLASSTNQTTFSTQIRAANIVTEINKQIINTFKNLDSDICNNLNFQIDKTSGFGAFKYNGSISPDTQIVIDFNVNNNAVRTHCSDNQLYQKLGWQLGFRQNQITLDVSNATQISKGICYINYPRYLYIAIDDFQSSARNYFSIASDSIVAPNIVGRINILSLLEEKTAFKSAAAPGDFLYTQKHIREYFGPTDINKLKIQLLDEYGRPFTLNNMDWSFILSFECFYN